MSKVIKVDEDIYRQLDKLRGKSDTFGQVIANLLEARVKILDFLTILEGAIGYHDHREKELQRLQGLERERDSAQVHNVRAG